MQHWEGINCTIADLGNCLNFVMNALNVVIFFELLPINFVEV